MSPEVFSPLIQKALSFAIKVHEQEQQQRRKGKDIPYITHPLAVGLILARVTPEELVIVAGILHDVIEDCRPYGSVTPEVLEAEFGEKVARIVTNLTEPPRSVPWPQRKQIAIDHIKEMDRDSLLVKAADVVHNMADLSEDLEMMGDHVFTVFTAGRAETLSRFQQVIIELEEAWPDNPLLPDLHFYFNKLRSL